MCALENQGGGQTLNPQRMGRSESCAWKGDGDPLSRGEGGMRGCYCLELLQGADPMGWVGQDLCPRPPAEGRGGTEAGLWLGWALGTRTLCLIY